MSQALYFFKVTAIYSCKNKLYEEFQAFAEKQDATLITGNTGLAVFKQRFKQELERLQEKHSRCKKLRFEMSTGYSKDVQVDLKDFGSWRGEIYKVNTIQEL